MGGDRVDWECLGVGADFFLSWAATTWILRVIQVFAFLGLNYLLLGSEAVFHVGVEYLEIMLYLMVTVF